MTNQLVIKLFYIEDELESPQPITEQLKSSADHQVNIHTSRSGVCEPVTSYEIMTSSSTTTATSGRNQNLLEMLRSDPSINPISCHDDLSESEARTMACDFDYGVQIADGSVNRERKLMDWRPVSPETACFDPYKWDHCDVNSRVDKDDKHVTTTTTDQSAAVGKSEKTISRDGTHDVASSSDHGYHSSYCSSNVSGGKPTHSVWSLSSPDVSIDHEHRAAPVASIAAHRAPTPDTDDHHDPSDSHLDSSPAASVDVDDVEVPALRKPHQFDDVIPHHHQTFHHIHHHHHHHHHKHHRHRHSLASSQSSQRTTPENQIHQRHCLVEEVVPESVEESSVETQSDNPHPSSSGKRNLHQTRDRSDPQKSDQRMDEDSQREILKRLPDLHPPFKDFSGLLNSHCSKSFPYEN